MQNVAIIPARGGSKRLPKKNILDFMGKPIIEWTISAAQESGLFDRIVVSTEDDEIARIASDSGAEIDQRSPSLATDESTVNQVCLDFLDKEKENGRQYDVICCLYATAPLRNSDDIKQTMHLVTAGLCDHSMAVTHFDLPAFQAMYCSDANELTPMCPDLTNRRSSELGKIVVGNGSTYVATVRAFRENEGFVGPDIRGYLMPRKRSVDIDLAEDYEMAIYYAGLLGIGEE